MAAEAVKPWWRETIETVAWAFILAMIIRTFIVQAFWIPSGSMIPTLEINDVWLSVAFGNAQPVYRRTLKKGEVMRWDLNESARVSFGRPTAAQVILNGKDLGIVNPNTRRAETYIYNPDGTFRRATAR